MKLLTSNKLVTVVLAAIILIGIVLILILLGHSAFRSMVDQSMQPLTPTERENMEILVTDFYEELLLENGFNYISGDERVSADYRDEVMDFQNSNGYFNPFVCSTLQPPHDFSIEKITKVSASTVHVDVGLTGSTTEETDGDEWERSVTVFVEDTDMGWKINGTDCSHRSVELYVPQRISVEGDDSTDQPEESQCPYVVESRTITKALPEDDDPIEGAVYLLSAITSDRVSGITRDSSQFATSMVSRGSVTNISTNNGTTTLTLREHPDECRQKVAEAQLEKTLLRLDEVSKVELLIAQ